MKQSFPIHEKHGDCLDEPKRHSNLDDHGIDFTDVREGFDFTTADILASYEGRYKATGFLGDSLITVVFA